MKSYAVISIGRKGGTCAMSAYHNARAKFVGFRRLFSKKTNHLSLSESFPFVLIKKSASARVHLFGTGQVEG
jgi:hypothetical protein